MTIITAAKPVSAISPRRKPVKNMVTEGTVNIQRGPVFSLPPVTTSISISDIRQAIKTVAEMKLPRFAPIIACSL